MSDDDSKPRIIELAWDCKECSTSDIKGRLKRCPNCGSPREKAEMKMGGLGAEDYDSRGINKARSVTERALIDMASSGADWFCSHCGAGNRGDTDRCEGLDGNGCGAPRYAKPEEDHPDFAGDHKKVKGWDEKLEEEQEGGWATNQPGQKPKPKKKPQPRTPIEPRPEDEWATTQKAGMFAGISGILAGLTLFAGVCLVIGFFIWAFRTHETKGYVSNMAWSHTTVVERWTDVSVRKWEDETTQRKEVRPVNGKGERAGMVNIGGCREEHHHDEKYVCGSHKVCKDIMGDEKYSCTKQKRVTSRSQCGESCRDNGNGFATCHPKSCYVDYQTTCTRRVKTGERCWDEDDYCKRPIYETKCDFRTQEWKTFNSIPTSGTGLNTLWPKAELGPVDRLRYTADYTVTISYEDGQPYTYEHKPAKTKTLLGQSARMTQSEAREAEGLYKQWKPGEEVTVIVNNLGGIREVRHGTETIQAEEEHP
jgi:hypothetical protein